MWEDLGEKKNAGDEQWGAEGVEAPSQRAAWECDSHGKSRGQKRERKPVQDIPRVSQVDEEIPVYFQDFCRNGSLMAGMRSSRQV